jgi:hypothetical protein
MNFIVFFATTIPSQHIGKILYSESILSFIINHIDISSMLIGVPVDSPCTSLRPAIFTNCPSISPLMTKEWHLCISLADSVENRFSHFQWIFLVLTPACHFHYSVTHTMPTR